MLFESIDAITNAKYLEDKYQIRINEQRKLIEEMKDDKYTFETKMKDLMADNDRFKQDLKDIVDLKAKMEREKAFIQAQNKETILALRERINKLTIDVEKFQAENGMMVKNCRVMKLEVEKMRQRIVKIKNRKGKVDMGIKSCRNCGKEYTEKDNFKWSCRTHQSDYGGEMWWCCGKSDPNTPGCKYSCHESKEDEEDDDEEKKFKELAHNKN